MHQLRVLIPDKGPRDKQKETLIRLSIPRFAGFPNEREGISTRFLHHIRREDGLLCRQRARPSGTLDKSHIQLSTIIIEPPATTVKIIPLGRQHRAWQFFRAAGKIDGVNAIATRMVGLGNSHRRGLAGFIATPATLVFNGRVVPHIQ